MDKIIVDIPIVCTLNAADLDQRRQEVGDSIFSQAEAWQELADGYQFRFPGSDEWADQLLDFIKFERRCCPFFKFELSFEPNQSYVWLSLRGGEGVKDFLRAEFLPMKD